MADDPVQLAVFHYAAVRHDEALAASLGITPRQRASLLAHPYLLETDPAVVALRRGERTLARIGMFPGRVRMGGAEHRIHWGTDWSASSGSGVGGMAGVLLLRALRETGSLGAWGMSEVASPIYKAARFTLATLPRQAMVIRSRPVLQRKLGSAALARALGVPVDSVLHLVRRALMIGGGGRAFTCEPVAELGPDFDELDDRAAPATRFLRDSRELNWAIRHPWLGPEDRHRFIVLGIHARRSRALAGCAVARIRHHDIVSQAGYRDLTLGSILRFVVDPAAEGAAQALLTATLSALADMDVDAIELCTGDRRVGALAARYGMLEAGAMRVGLRMAPSPASAAQRADDLLALAVHHGEGDALFS